MKRVETDEQLYDLDREERQIDARYGSMLVAESPKRQRLVLDPLMDPQTPQFERERLHKVLKLLDGSSLQKKQDLYAVLELVSNSQKGGSKMLSQQMLDKIPLSTSLQLACIFGDLNLVRALVTRGHELDTALVDPNFRRGRSALSISAEMGFTEICEYLIDQGAEVDHLLDPPLRMAAESSNGDTAKLLIEKGADPNPILHELLWPSTAPRTIKLLLNAGALPNAHLLLTALWRGCGFQVIHALLRAGCPTRSDTESDSAIQVAMAQKADKEVIKLLVKKVPVWMPERHQFFTSHFKRLAFTLALCNRRAGAYELSPAIFNRILYWTAVAEKRDQDWVDLRAILLSRWSSQDLATRIESVYGNRYPLESLKADHLLQVLFFVPPPPPPPPAPVQQAVKYTGDDYDEDVAPSPKKKKKKKKQKSGDTKRTRVDPAERRARAHSSVMEAQKGNLNLPRSHHCSCCHVCHVSMKQRPRPVCACSNCNTIVCKICLEERWRDNLWEVSRSTPNWMCPKCSGTCICKSCKSKAGGGLVE